MCAYLSKFIQFVLPIYGEGTQWSTRNLLVARALRSTHPLLLRHRVLLIAPPEGVGPVNHLSHLCQGAGWHRGTHIPCPRLLSVLPREASCHSKVSGGDA